MHTSLHSKSVSLSLSLTNLQHVVVGKSQLWIPYGVKDSLGWEVNDPLAHEAGVGEVLCLLAQDNNILLITSKPTEQAKCESNIVGIIILYICQQREGGRERERGERERERERWGTYLHPLLWSVKVDGS